MELLTELAPVLYGLAAGVVGALLCGRAQRRLAYQRGHRHALAYGPRPISFGRDFFDGMTVGMNLAKGYPAMLEKLKELEAKRSQPGA
jgi:hypothetical protein